MDWQFDSVRGHQKVASSLSKRDFIQKIPIKIKNTISHCEKSVIFDATQQKYLEISSGIHKI
jgi:hypothetical protein